MLPVGPRARQTLWLLLQPPGPRKEGGAGAYGKRGPLSTPTTTSSPNSGRQMVLTKTSESKPAAVSGYGSVSSCLSPRSLCASSNTLGHDWIETPAPGCAWAELPPRADLPRSQHWPQLLIPDGLILWGTLSSWGSSDPPGRDQALTGRPDCDHGIQWSKDGT